jgi:predicted RNA polymerase sigma factor
VWGGDHAAARAAYTRAARLATNTHHARYLNTRAQRLGPTGEERA